MSSIKYNKILADYDKHCIRISQATSINLNESHVDKMNRIANLEKDYIRWFEYYFPNLFLPYNNQYKIPPP